jgi:hypothetical protein
MPNWNPKEDILLLGFIGLQAMRLEDQVCLGHSVICHGDVRAQYSVAVATDSNYLPLEFRRLYLH